MKYITIIGSRKITREEHITLRSLADHFHEHGFTLRSGGAYGADSSINHLSNIEIYIPWDGYNNLYHNGKTIFMLKYLPDQYLASKKVSEIHPKFEKLSRGAKLLQTRNIYQIIGYKGKEGTPSECVIYAADHDKNGEPVGGTRTAVMYARSLGIPTINIRLIDGLLLEPLSRMEWNNV